MEPQQQYTVSELFKDVEVMLKEACDENGLWGVSKMVVTTPSQFGACLGLPHELTTYVDRNYADYRDKIYHLLISWRAQWKHRGTWSDLVETLGQLSERVLLEGVRDILVLRKKAASSHWKDKPLSTSLDSGIGRDLSASISEPEAACRGVATPTTYSSFATCSSLSYVEMDGSNDDPYPSLRSGAQTAAQDPYPSLYLGAQSRSDSSFPGVEQPFMDGDSAPVFAKDDVSNPSPNAACFMATGHSHVDTFYTPFSTLEEDHTSSYGANPGGNSNKQLRRYLSDVGSPPSALDPPVGSGDMLYEQQLFRPARHTFRGSSDSIHYDRSDGLHTDGKATELLRKLHSCVSQISCSVKQLKWKNEELILRRQALADKKDTLVEENKKLEQSLRCHRPVQLGKRVQKYMSELSRLRIEYEEAIKVRAQLTQECAGLKVQCDKEVEKNLVYQVRKNMVKQYVQSTSRVQHLPNVFQRQRSFSDSDCDSSLFNSSGPSSSSFDSLGTSLECHL